MGCARLPDYATLLLMDRNLTNRPKPYADIVMPQRRTTVPAPSSQPPIPEPEKQAPRQATLRTKATKEKVRFFTRKRLVISCVTAFSATVLGIALLGYMASRDHSPLDRYARITSFPIYYPAEIPETYALDTSSIQNNGGLLFYTFNSDSKKPAITITQQSMPPGFEAGKFVSKDAPAPLQTPEGALYNIGTNSQTKYMLTASGTLLFINAPSKVPPEIINLLATKLQRVN